MSTTSSEIPVSLIKLKVEMSFSTSSVCNPFTIHFSRRFTCLYSDGSASWIVMFISSLENIAFLLDLEDVRFVGD